tara:strand:- start:2733 stop:3065 length:333 start_codon:yes stop_codon:yes gene_type:complete
MLKGLTKAETQKLLLNSKESLAHEGGLDHKPVVKYFYMQATWLISEMDDDGTCFGLCDLGHGFPELGYVLAQELNGLKQWGGVQKDRYFKADKMISEYAADARSEGYINA